MPLRNANAKHYHPNEPSGVRYELQRNPPSRGKVSPTIEPQQSKADDDVPNPTQRHKPVKTKFGQPEEQQDQIDDPIYDENRCHNLNQAYSTRSDFCIVSKH